MALPVLPTDGSTKTFQIELYARMEIEVTTGSSPLYPHHIIRAWREESSNRINVSAISFKDYIPQQLNISSVLNGSQLKCLQLNEAGISPHPLLEKMKFKILTSEVHSIPVEVSKIQDSELYALKRIK